MSTATPTSAAGPRESTRKTPDQVIAASGLPDELASLVRQVIAQTRLWRRERADVARELCAHFADGLASGAHAALLARDFGEPAQAARLITLARKRLRPWWWRGMRRGVQGARWGLAAIVMLYALLALRYFAGSPTISRNYAKEMNAPALATPAEQRAWPAYLDAIVLMGKPGDDVENALASRPGSPEWPAARAWLRASTAGLTRVREGASRTHVGVVVGTSLDPAYADALRRAGRGDPGVQGPAAENPLLMGVLLPYLGEMRRFGRLLDADRRLAEEDGDAARVVADIRAIVGMSVQLRDDSTLIGQLVGLALLDMASRAALDAAARPGLLDEPQLRTMAHTLAGAGRPRLNFAGERAMLDDIVQRFYTDDGRGNGRFVHSPETDRLYTEFGVVRPRALPLLQAFQPVRGLTMPSRREMNDRIERLITQAHAAESLPPWRHHERSLDAAYREVHATGIYRILPIVESLAGGDQDDPLGKAIASRDIVDARREAAMVALALAQHHRATGRWPASLHELVPAQLPAIPRDPFDGEPLRYRPPATGSALPTLYLVGVDGVDDSGVPATTSQGRNEAASLRLFAAFRNPGTSPPELAQVMIAAKGDVMLWPPLPDPEN